MMDFLLREGHRPAAHAYATAPRYIGSPVYLSSQPSFADATGTRRVVARHRTAQRHVAANRTAPARAAVVIDGRPEARPAASPVPSVSGAGAADAHLTDKTLRRGDIVATVSGLRIFKGAEHFPFVDSDFASISRGRHVQNVAMLQAIDRMIRRDHWAENAKDKAAKDKTAKIAAARPAPTAAVRAAALPHVQPRRHVASRKTEGHRVLLAYASASSSTEVASMKAIDRVQHRPHAGKASRSRRSATGLARVNRQMRYERVARYYYGPQIYSVASDGSYTSGLWRVVYNR
ncbi:MAG: hypothetical protein KGM42_15690 [Hyphomicrobiales bacterium]|nr:hypothetical protein [Hyphomicrobiales bacterium]